MGQILITNGTVVTMDATSSILPSAWVLIRDNMIVAVGSGAYPSDIDISQVRKIDASEKLIVPGLINAHTHLCQGLMRNMSFQYPLTTWLESIRPFRLNMTPDDLRLSIKLALLENVKNGVTSVVHHHKVTLSDEHIEAALEGIGEIDIRTLFVLAVRQSDSLTIIRNRLEYLKKYVSKASNCKIKIGIGPTYPLTLSGQQIQSVIEMAQAYQIPLHMHVAETLEEVSKSLAVYGDRPIERLYKLKGLYQGVELVHCVHVSEEEINMIAKNGAIVVHAPVSNLYLASGIAPINMMLDRGIPVAIGTDGPASNNSQNLLESMKFASLLANVYSFGATISPSEVLKMTFQYGSLAMKEKCLGQISPGMFADITIINQSGVRNFPHSDLKCSIINSTSPAEIDTVISDGKILYENGNLLSCDEEGLIANAEKALHRINRSIEENNNHFLTKEVRNVSNQCRRPL